MRDFPWSLGNVGFSDGLQSIHSLRVLLSYLHDLSKAALADDFEKVEGIYCQRLISGGPEVNLEVERARSCCGVVPLIGCML